MVHCWVITLLLDQWAPLSGPGVKVAAMEATWLVLPRG